MLFLAKRSEVCWILDLICQDLTCASGACHRSLQLYELLQAGGFNLTPIPVPPRPRWAALGFQGLAHAFSDGLYRPYCYQSLRNTGYQASFCRDLFACYPHAKGLIMEGTGYGSLIRTAWCRRNGKKSILVPANLESLAPHTSVWPYKSESLSRRFQYELPWYRQADAIFTIAIEEAWLLELYGVRCEHLPYYPPSSHRLMLESLACARRHHIQTSDYLFLADFNNPPNLYAAYQLVNWLEKNPQFDQLVLVAGRASERLFTSIPSHLSSRIQVLGEVTDIELWDLQLRCKALLLLHPPTSGMLTRIIDATFADLPVVGDWMSFKTYHNYFSNCLLSPQICTSTNEGPKPAVIQVPPRPHQAEARLLEILSY